MTFFQVKKHNSSLKWRRGAAHVTHRHRGINAPIQILKLLGVPRLQVGFPSATALSCRRRIASKNRRERVCNYALSLEPRALSATSAPKGANGAFTVSLPTTTPHPAPPCPVATRRAWAMARIRLSECSPRWYVCVCHVAHS